MAPHHPRYDALVIGGGVIGCTTALFLAEHVKRVVLVEREAGLLRRASFNNQARVHRGYHYPRSLLTALRSRVNFPRFSELYRECIRSDFRKYYGIAREYSKVTAGQFQLFCGRIEAPIFPVSDAVRGLFTPSLIEEVFEVEEYAFDAPVLAARLSAELNAAGVEVRTGGSVTRMAAAGSEIVVDIEDKGGKQSVRAGNVMNCTYSSLNEVLAASALPMIPLRHELTEMALVRVPSELTDKAITVMCGPFFSVMPFPARGLHTLSHVRYTPHSWWEDRPGHPYTTRRAGTALPPSNFRRMRQDAQRYVPLLRECEYVESLWEIKTILPNSEMNDSRPILFRPSHALRNLTCILGGKIDNVFDVIDELDEWRRQGGLA